MDIGARLREAREEKNLSLEQLQETTKIQKRYLAAIEENKFSLLPGKFYAKAFIKEYANAVGLDPQELLEAFQGMPAEQEKQKEETEYTQIKQPVRDRSSRNTGSLLPKITVFLLIIAIIVLAVVFYNKTATNSSDPVKNKDGNEIIRTPDDEKTDEEVAKQKREKAAEQKQEEKQAEKEKKEKKESKEAMKQKDKESDKVSIAVAEKGSGSSPESKVNVETDSDTVKITLKPTGKGDSWLDAKAGSESKFSGTFAKGQSPIEMELKKGEEVYLVIGNAPAVDIDVNGEKMDYPVNQDEKVFQKIHLNLKGSEE